MREFPKKLPPTWPFIVFGILMMGLYIGLSVFSEKKNSDLPLETQMTTTLQALQENFQQAATLTARLQTEVANRRQALQEAEAALEELRHRRTLLDLTPEQQKALQGLIQQPRSWREMLTSLDFWLGNVFPEIFFGAAFFALGIWYERRRGKTSVTSTAENQ